MWQLPFKEYVTKKERVSIDFMSDQPNNAFLTGVACSVTEAVDHLSARLQSCDYTGQSISEARKAIPACQHALFALMNPVQGDLPVAPPSRATWVLETLVHHFDGVIPKEDVVDKVSRESTELSAIIWSRMELFLGSGPMQWLDPDHDVSETYRKALCYFDEAFEEVIMDACPNPASFEEQFGSLMTALRHRLQSTNMSTENLIAQIKSSRPPKKQKPSIEELA